MEENKDKIVFGLMGGALAGSLFLLVLLYNSSATKTSFSHILPPDPYAEVVLQAKAAFVYKPQNGKVLYAKNSEIQLPLASITKVMSAIIAKENLAPGAKVLFEENDWQITNLLNYVLMVSSNEGISAIAAVASSNLAHGCPNELSGQACPESSSGHPRMMNFVNAMNTKASELNLNQTYFLDESGLDMSDTQSGAYGSASDTAKLFAYALATIPEVFEATTLKDTWFYVGEEGKYSAVNTNEAIGAVPGLIAGKTGYTDLAGGNLVVAFDPGMGDPIIAVVLGSTKAGRFEDIKKLVRASLQQF